MWSESPRSNYWAISPTGSHSSGNLDAARARCRSVVRLEPASPPNVPGGPRRGAQLLKARNFGTDIVGLDIQVHVALVIDALNCTTGSSGGVSNIR